MESNKGSFRSSCRFISNLALGETERKKMVKTPMFLSIKADKMPSSDIFLEICCSIILRTWVQFLADFVE